MLSSPAYTGIAEQASPACPGREPDRHRDRRRRRRHPPALHARQGLPRPAPTRARRSASWSSSRPSRGPTTSATSSCASAIYVDPVTAQVTTVSDPLPQILEGIPLRLRSILVNLDRPDFTLNPTNCDPFTVDTTVVRRRRRRVDHLEPLPGRQLRQPRLRAEAQPEAAAARPSGAATRPCRAVLQDRRGRSQPRAASRSRCRRASCSTTPTSARSAPGSSSPPTACPADSIYGSAHGRHAAARPAAQRARLPALLEPQAARTWSSTCTGRSTSRSRAGSTPSRTAALRARFTTRPGRAGLEIRPRPARRQEGPAAEQQEPLQGRQEGDGGDDRPERQQTTTARSSCRAACGSKASRHKRHLRRLYRSRVVR